MINHIEAEALARIAGQHGRVLALQMVRSGVPPSVCLMALTFAIGNLLATVSAEASDDYLTNVMLPTITETESATRAAMDEMRDKMTGTAGTVGTARGVH